MTKTELLEIISNGESSGVEFKRDDITPRDLAEEVVSFSNFEGGVILLGVEDDGEITGINENNGGQNKDQWVVNICRDKVDPPIIPYYEEVRTEDGVVGVIKVLQGTGKPYAVEHHNHRYYYIRAGDENRECSREEIIRLSQSSGQLNLDMQPVSGAKITDLDYKRITQYFELIREESTPDEDATDEWKRLLHNMDFLHDSDDELIPTLGAVLLFGENPNRYLPQAGVRFLAYRGSEEDYDALKDEKYKGPLVALLDEEDPSAPPMESGVVEETLDSLKDYVPEEINISLGRREKTGNVADALREIIVNALVHRDYSIAGRDVTVTVYSDRVEVSSPGRLPNTVTIEGIKRGTRYMRNQLIVNVMSDYAYMEHRGQGIKNKVIPIMEEFNNTEPEFEEQRNEFKVILKL